MMTPVPMVNNNNNSNMSNDDDDGGDVLIMWTAGNEPTYCTPQKIPKDHPSLQSTESTEGTEGMEPHLNSLDEKKKQELTPSQKERIRQNREAAIARRQVVESQKSRTSQRNYLEDDSNSGYSNSGWRVVRKRPSVEPVSPLSRQKLDSEIPDLPTPYFRTAVKNNPPEQEKTGVQGKPIPASKGDSHEVQFMPSDQQMKALSAIARQQSVFLTGSAGTGKSYILKYAIKQLRNMYGSDTVFVTASTGLAACSIGGTTVHSFAGIGLGTESKETLADKVGSRRESRGRWSRARALVIDEISMVDAELFDKLDYIGRVIRKNNKPFGGLQLVVTGDFFQLPPVSPGNQQKNFSFEADCWKSCFQLQVEFTKVFRQSDSQFINMLNELRRGICSPETLKQLTACSTPRSYPNDGIIMTKLYPKKVDVGRENEQKLSEIRDTEMVYRAEDTAKSEYAKKLLENTRVEKVLSLRKGAQVILLKNLDPTAGLANGARGVVVGFCDPNDPGAAQFKGLVKSINPSGMWPVVRFASLQQEYIMGPEAWAIEEGGLEVAKRSQVPLALAWALSVHKCQGMTLDRVETNLRNAFDYGMVYVALSRVKSLEGLHLIGFDPAKIKVHPKVARFYEELNAAL